MKNLTLRLFEVTLFFFALTVILTMYSMTSGDEEGQLFGWNYGYFLAPLFLINVYIGFTNINHLSFNALKKYLFFWIIIVSINVLVLVTNKAINLIRVNVWTTSFFSAYYLAKNNNRTVGDIKKMFLVVYGISFVVFWMGKIFQQDNIGRGMEASSNAIYCLVTIIPFIMLLNNKVLQLLLTFITFVCTVFSNKRGATIIVALILMPMLNSVFSKMKNKVLRFFLILLLIVAAVGSFFYFSNNFLGGKIWERFSETEETGGSGRLEIWSYLLYRFQQSALFEQLLGHGHYSVSSVVYATAAHNDFIEVLFDYGIIGFIVYLGIHICLIKKILYLRKYKNPLFYPFISMYLIFFVMSMVSILIVQQRYLIYMAVFWGILEGCGYDEKLIWGKK